MCKVKFSPGFINLIFNNSSIIFDTYRRMYGNPFLKSFFGNTNVYMNSAFMLACALPSVFDAIFKKREDEEQSYTDKLAKRMQKHT